MTYPCTIYRICLFCMHLKTTLHIAVQTSYRHLAGTDGLYCTLFVLYQKLSLFINSQGRSLPGLIRIKNTDRLIPVCQKLIIFFHHSGKAAGPDNFLQNIPAPEPESESGHMSFRFPDKEKSLCPEAQTVFLLNSR